MNHTTRSRREFLKFGIGAGSALLIAGCTAPASSKATAAPAAASGGAAATRPFVYAVRTEAVTMNPHVNDLSYSLDAQRPVYEALLEYKVGSDGKVDLGPLLAAKWDVSTDGKTYTFTLQKNVKFQDGTPFNADAVKWNIDRLMTLKLPPSGRIPPLDNLEVVDPSTIRFILKNPFAPFLASMAMPLMVSPTAARSHDKGGDVGMAWLDGNAVGTGPYKLDQWLRGQQVSFSRNPDYWGGWSGNHLDKIVLKTVKEAATQREMLETGDADLADGIGFNDLDALSKAPGVVVQPGTSPEVLNIGLHTQKPPFDNVKVRQAVAYAFNYDSFVKGVLNGRAETPNGPIPLGTWAADQTAQPYVRNLEKAKQLIAEAKLPSGTKVRIQTITAYGWYQAGEAQILQQNLKELGIDATINDMADAATFLAALQNKENGPEIFFWRAPQAIDDPDYELRRLYDSAYVGKAGVNGMWYQSKQFDDLLDKALATPDRTQRKPLYDQISKLLRDDQPAIWPAQLNFYVTRRDALQGFVWNPFSVGVPPYRNLWLSK